VRRGISAILEHPWIPTTGPDAVTVRGFVYDVDNGRLSEVSYPGPTAPSGEPPGTDGPVSTQARASPSSVSVLLVRSGRRR